MEKNVYNDNIIYVIGHKNNDTDSVCAAIAYAYFKNKLNLNNNFNIKYVATRPSDINLETQFILDYFDIKAPIQLKDAKGKKLILVDHNQSAQMVDGVEIENIVEILDHHNVNFSSGTAIQFHVEPLGSTSTIIAKMYFDSNILLKKGIAGILLGAILSDTVIFKSPITTDIDKDIAKKLAKIAGVKNIESFGIDAFKAKSCWGNLTTLEIINTDYKEYDVKSFRFAITQVETVDPSDLETRKNDILLKMKFIKDDKKLNCIIVMVTDIIKEGCLMFALADSVDLIEKTFGEKLINNQMYLKGVLSRKKQVVPPLTEYLDKNLN
ncbi:MAG: manganese-dependent inorganic pyrophosphatase [DPANN group archaeon]|nr:manganese-dependent inorganic pyrophosphatase [DPANN group archaeon]